MREYETEVARERAAKRKRGDSYRRLSAKRNLARWMRCNI